MYYSTWRCETGSIFTCASRQKCILASLPVDVIRVAGGQLSCIMPMLNNESLLNEASQVRGGRTVELLGSTTRRGGNDYVFGCNSDCVDEVIRPMGVQRYEGSITPGTSTLNHLGGGVATLSGGRQARPVYCGKARVDHYPLRSCFLIKLLGISAQAPTEEDDGNMNRLVKHRVAAHIGVRGCTR